MSCGRLPEDFGEPLPRWAALPGDPAPLRRALARQRPVQPTDDDMPPPPEEEPL